MPSLHPTASALPPYTLPGQRLRHLPAPRENLTHRATCCLQFHVSDFCTHHQKPPFNGWRGRRHRDPSPTPTLPTPCHRPRPLKFLVKYPSEENTGANLAGSQKCLYSETRTWPPNRSTPAIPLQQSCSPGPDSTPPHRSHKSTPYTQNPGTQGQCQVSSQGTQRSSWQLPACALTRGSLRR